MKNIYVVCPAQWKTGGPELLHQLVFEINKLGANKAFIAYPRDDRFSLDESTHYSYKRYIGKGESIFLEDVDDCENNVIIVPETIAEEVKRFNNSKIYVWWLSVDNFFHIKHGLARLIRKIKFPSKLKKYGHLSQSNYSSFFLKRKGLKPIYLSDYINSDFLQPNFSTDRSDTVLYNPKKGYKFTKKLIERNNDITFVPLENMSNEQLKNAMMSSKIYIDFGHHPGKDRIPREAALNGCIIITSKLGSANFYDDVMIPDEYKFETKPKNIDAISKKIKNSFQNYNTETENFQKYRNRILCEYKKFIEDIKSFLEIINK